MQSAEPSLVNLRRSVDLPTPCFNQYNIVVLRSTSHPVRPNFASFVTKKFGRGPILIVASEQPDVKQQFDALGVEAISCASVGELISMVPQNGTSPPAHLGIWFYPPDKSDDERAVEEIATRSREVLLISSLGAEIATRRPALVERFQRFGLVPDYQ